MTAQERYLALRELLLPWSALWGRSVFDRFEEAERLVPPEWFEYGARSTPASQLSLAQGAQVTDAPRSLIEWARSIRELCRLDAGFEPNPIPPPYDQYLTPKKRHEIEALLGFMRSEAISPARVLDIGGGSGHLARQLSREVGCPVDSLDRDPAVQDKGRRIQDSWPWKKHLANPVRWISGSFPEVAWNAQANPTHWTLGLHTCGALAWSHLELARARYSVLNIGCCYEKLDLLRDTQRSRAAREYRLPLTEEALFLANRGGVERSLEEFEFQQRVLRCRFTLQELLVWRGRVEPGRDSVGTASTEVYRGTFAGYARDRLDDPGLTDEALEEFRRSAEPRVERQRFVTLLRNLLARPLELAILLDRALWLEETACVRQRLIELFDARISPRNLALLATRTG